MNKLIAIMATAFLFVASPAHAQKIDLTKMTCKQFIETSAEQVAAIVTWLSGYYSDEDDPAIVDFDKIKEASEKLADYCRKKPNEEFMDAADEIMEKK